MDLNQTEEMRMFDRLVPGASSIIAMLKGVLSGPKGTDMFLVTLFAAGLAGIACHEAVRESGKEMTVVTCENGKKYYMGDAINNYLYEDTCSVTKLVRATIKVSDDALTKIITRQAQTIGTKDFLVAGRMDPNDVYKKVKNCWDGIMDNMTLRFCEKPEEWPILYAIVLQNIMMESTGYAPEDIVFNTAMDVVIAMSKMDKESL